VTFGKGIISRQEGKSSPRSSDYLVGNGSVTVCTHSSTLSLCRCRELNGGFWECVFLRCLWKVCGYLLGWKYSAQQRKKRIFKKMRFASVYLKGVNQFKTKPWQNYYCWREVNGVGRDFMYKRLPPHWLNLTTYTIQTNKQGNHTKKVGICGKYGTRYGATLRKVIKKMEVTQHSKYNCNFCGKTA